MFTIIKRKINITTLTSRSLLLLFPLSCSFCYKHILMAGMFDSQTLSSSSGSIKHLQSTHKEKIYRSFKGSGVSTLVNILHHIINYCGEISNLKAVTSFGWKTFFNKSCQQRLMEASDDGA